MAIVIDDLSGIGAGIQTAGSALAGALERRASSRLQQQQQGALNKSLENADLSSQEGQQEFVRSYTQAGGEMKDALSAVKQFQPSGLERLLKSQGYDTSGEIAGQSSLQQSPSPQDQPQGTLETVVGIEDVHPALRNTPFNKIPDEVIAMASTSVDPREKNFGDAISDARDKAHRRYNEDRKYATTRTKKYGEEIADLRRTSQNQKIALNEIEFGLNNRESGTATMDWWASNLGKWAQPLVSAEGNLIQSGVKNYLISDLKGVKGRPNQFLEGLLLDSLPGLGKTNLANQALATGLRYRDDIDHLRIETFDKLTEQYEGPEGIGFVPANIDRLVAEQMKPIVDEWGDKHAYNLRQIQEQEQGIDSVSRRKVVQGTPLTIEMMTFFADKYGLDKAVKRAEKMGYRIPSKAEYERYQK